MTARKIDILGVDVSVLDLERATREILDALEAGSKGYVCVTGAHGIVEALDDPQFRGILNGALLCVPDGMPVVWIGKFIHGKTAMGRVYGPDLMWEIFRATEGSPVRHFLYGGGPGVAERLAERLRAHFPGTTIAGTWCPPYAPLDPSEEEALRKLLQQARPDILWVGLSTPKQEKFMAGQLGRLPAALMIGVGAAFDFHAGLIQQAPAWMRGAGLEWLFRLAREPGRLWPRYRRVVPRFLLALAGQTLFARRGSGRAAPR